MAHFAQLDNNNVVTQVIVVANEELLDNDVESEAKGIAFCKSLFGNNTNWIQTSYNGKFRKNFASVAFTYDQIANHFFAPQPFSSWVLNTNAQWEAPVVYPTDGKLYSWDETVKEWVEVILPN